VDWCGRGLVWPWIGKAEGSKGSPLRQRVVDLPHLPFPCLVQRPTILRAPPLCPKRLYPGVRHQVLTIANSQLLWRETSDAAAASEARDRGGPPRGRACGISSDTDRTIIACLGTTPCTRWGKYDVDMVHPAILDQSCPPDPAVHGALPGEHVKSHFFTLILESPRELTEAFEDAVFESGCGDAALSQRSGVLYLEFDRDAPSFRAALLSAIRDVQRTPGTIVSRVEPDDLVTASEVAHRLGRSRESVRLLAEGSRGPGHFPLPVSGASGRRVRLWRWTEVSDWLHRVEIAPGYSADAYVVAAVNGALDLMRHADAPVREEILLALACAPAP